MIPTAPSGAQNQPLLSVFSAHPQLCLWRVPQVTLGWCQSWGCGTAVTQVLRLLEVGAALPFFKLTFHVGALVTSSGRSQYPF